MKDADTISIEDALAAIELDDICSTCTDWSGYTTELVRDRVWEVADECAKGDESTLLDWLKDPQNKGAILEAENRDIFRVEFDITNIELELAEGTLTREQQLRVAAVGRSIANEEHLYDNMDDIYLYQALEKLRRGGMTEVPTAWIEDMRKWLEDDLPMTFADWSDDGPGYAMEDLPAMTVGYDKQNECPDIEQKSGRTAVSVGYCFTVVDDQELTDINLKPTGQEVVLAGKVMPLMAGATFSDSQKVDDLLDRHGELRTDEYINHDVDSLAASATRAAAIRRAYIDKLKERAAARNRNVDR